MKRGFTLIEVCVALPVLAASLAAFFIWIDAFLKLRSLERDEAVQFVEAVGLVESRIENPPFCSDTSFERGAEGYVKLERTGANGLSWLSVQVGAVYLKRLVKCYE